MTNLLLHYAGVAFFALLTIIAVIATVLPFFTFRQWYFRIFDYPRLQTFCIAVIVLVWYAVFYYKPGLTGFVILGMFSVIIIIQAYKAWPYTPLSPKQVIAAGAGVGDNNSISMYISNVLQTNRMYVKTIQKIQQYQPHIVITTETDAVWQEELSVLHDQYPHRVAVPQDNKYGMHLFSSLPLKNSSVRYLMEPDIPSIRTEIQLGCGEWVTLFIVHPRPPFPGESDDTSDRDAEIIMVAREASKETGSVIVAGDFNDVAWSETTELFQEVSGFLDPRRGRGFYNTFHSKYPIFRWPLDHIFHSTQFTLKALKRVANVNSDHFPMFIQLGFEPQKEHLQPEHPADEDTQEEADEAIRQGNE